MKILNKNIYFNDFIPPLIPKGIRFVLKKLFKLPPNPHQKLHPFNQVPKDIQAKWVLDIGANEGHVAVAALESYPDCKVICFEPVMGTFKILKENLLPYEDRVILYNQALSDKNGVGEINLTSFHGANSIEPQSMFHRYFNSHVREVGKEKITLTQLDDIAPQFPTQTIDIMKIDVEGHELNVLKGGSKFVQSNVDTIIIEIALMRDQSWENPSIFDIFALLNRWGFRLINIVDLHYSNDSDMMLVQMDCVFRHKSKLTIP